MTIREEAKIAPTEKLDDLIERVESIRIELTNELETRGHRQVIDADVDVQTKIDNIAEMTKELEDEVACLSNCIFLALNTTST